MILSFEKGEIPTDPQALISLGSRSNHLPDQRRREEIDSPNGSIDELSRLMSDGSLEQNMFSAITESCYEVRKVMPKRGDHGLRKDLEELEIWKLEHPQLNQREGMESPSQAGADVKLRLE